MPLSREKLKTLRESLSFEVEIGKAIRRQKMFNGTLSVSSVPIFNFWSSYFLVSLDFLVILTENSTTQEIHDKINIFKNYNYFKKCEKATDFCSHGGVFSNILTFFLLE